MRAAQLTTLVVSVGYLAAALFWAIREARRDPERLPLNDGFRVTHVLAGLAVLAATVPLLWLVFSNELLPNGSPAAFGIFLGCYALGTVALIMVAVMKLVRRDAVGWLTLAGDRVHLRAPDIDEDIALEAGAVLAFPVAGKPQWLQLRLTLGDGRVFLLLAMVPIQRLQWAEGREPVAPRGLILGGGAKQLCDRLEPHVAH